MKNVFLLLKCIAIPLLVGILAALISGGGMKAFSMLNQPPLSPPGWLFPVVWTILYTLMGIASYLVRTSAGEKEQIKQAMILYGVQLAVNFLWPIFFFLFQWYLFAFAWLVFLWILIAAMIKAFYPLSKVAAYLMIPYLLWVTFAGYLNLAIAILN